MSKLGVLEDTLFVPMLGRIYASEYCPQILYDPKALELKKKLPSGLLGEGRPEPVYPVGLRRPVRQCGPVHPGLSGAQAGRCGRSAGLRSGDDLFPLRQRADRAGMLVDLPHVVEYRRALLSEPERETYLAGDAFAEDWIRQIRADVPDAPILVTAGGLFHYFEENKVVGLLRMLTGFGEIEIVFDTVSKSGMAMMRKKYMKQVGHRDAQMFFYVDSASELTGKIGSGVRVLAEEPYYRHIPRTGLKLSTKISMSVSDRFWMVKMVHLATE